MLQAPCYPSPVVYGQSHYKKFWLRQTETEDESPVVSASGPHPQHVASCPQKFSTLSSSFNPMAGTTSTPSQGQQNQGGTTSGTSNPSSSSSKASLAACTNSFNASRKAVPEYDLNQFEDSLEPGAVDCTLSLGTVKRDRPEAAAVPVGVSRSASPAFGEVAHYCNPPESPWTAPETQILFNTRNYPSDCTRDLYPQTTVPARQGRLAVGAQNHVYCGSAVSAIEGSKASSFPRPKKSPVYGSVEKKVVGVTAADAAGALENSNEAAYRARVVAAGGRAAIGLCRSSSSWMPSLVIPEAGVQSDNKYSCETPSPFSSSMIASPLSGHSSVSGDEVLFQHRSSSIVEIGANIASSTAKTVARTCAHCNTQKTPLWRNGPNGPKSLCNACGIRFKKAGKKNNPSTGSSSELGSPLAVSPTPARAAKRKKHNSFPIVAAAAAAGLSKHSNWGLDDCTGTGRRGYHQPPQQGEAPHPQPWKRNRASTAVRMEMTERLAVDINDSTTTESSATEGDENETGGSSGNSSCVTWQQQHQRSSVAAAATHADAAASALTAAAAGAATVGSTVLQVPSASAHALATVDASDRAADDRFLKMNDVMSVFPYKRAAHMMTMDIVDAEDSGTINAEEAALCLMKLSHGFGLRPVTTGSR